MIILKEKHVHIATGNERETDVLALYELKTRIRDKMELAGIVTENTTFPLSLGFSYVTSRKNVWILKIKYHTYNEWKANCEEYAWEFQICTDKETGEIFAIRPYKLPSGEVVCCMFSPFSFKEYEEYQPVGENNVCSVVNSLLEMLYLETVVEYKGCLYVSSRDMCIVGTPLALSQRVFLFDKQLYYRRMRVDKDAPRVICKEMLFRSMKLSMEWGEDDDRVGSQVYFQNCNQDY